jgi:hypothetical protein
MGAYGDSRHYAIRISLKENAPRASTRGLVSSGAIENLKRGTLIFSPASFFPARHSPTTRPCLARLGVAILRSPLLRSPFLRAVCLATRFARGRPRWGAVTERRELRLELDFLPSENAHAGRASDATHPSVCRTTDCRTMRRRCSLQAV